MLLVTLTWCLADFAAPVYHSVPIYYFFSTFCHQLASRSWHIHGEPLGLCVRCTAISLGFFAGLLLCGRPSPRAFRLAVAITVAEWLLAAAVFDSEVLRALTGVFLGITASPIVAVGVEEMFVRVRTAHEPM
jgi:uncharacterized membrane protein